MKDRTRARGIALQALYELDITNHPVGTVLQERADDSGLGDELIQFFRSIVLGVLPIREELDRFIIEHARLGAAGSAALLAPDFFRGLLLCAFFAEQLFLDPVAELPSRPVAVIRLGTGALAPDFNAGRVMDQLYA